MRQSVWARLAFVLVVFLGVDCSVHAQSVSDYAVQVSSMVQTNPPRITLSWPGDPGATGYSVYRKLLNDTAWSKPSNLGAVATSYVDTNVAVGGAYEYWIFKTASDYYGEAYIYAGIAMPLVESRGKVVLLVDNTFTMSMALELNCLQQDLVGDGWTVLMHKVARAAVDPADTSSSVWTARSNDLATVKGLVSADYQADPANVMAIFVIGHVPVPYSGDDALDEHPDHVGAWPADGFYGSVSGTWTDLSVNDTSASDTRNWNVPGDGKFDASYFSTNLTLEVGRADFANLPSFPQGESGLLRQYLEKDHNFRCRRITAQRRGLIDDNLGLLNGEVPAVDGWRTFAPFFGASNVMTTADWFGTLATNSYLWGYGCGPGTYTSCGGVGATTDFTTNDPQVVFTMFFGSYFGDWDSQDDFLRAVLGTSTYTLTSAWSGQPYWIIHPMALGETIGFSSLLTQNNSGLYDANYGLQSISIALMGDPTLRMHIVAPPSALLVSSNGSGGVNLSWNASPDTVLGYHVYCATTSAGPFTRLTTNLLTGLNYTDPAASTNVYMVRAVKLEVSGSGSYYNASQGIFQSLDGSAGAPAINLYQPTNNTTFGVGPTIQFNADTFDPANCITNVVFYANGVQIGQTNAPPYSVSWSNVPGGTYALTALAICSSGLATNSSAVTVHVAQGSMENTTTTLSLTTGSSSRIYGSALTLTAMVAGSMTTPGGIVVFKDGSNTLATVPLVAGISPNATAAYTSYTDLNVSGSPHSIAAYYQGDATHNPSDSSASPIAQTITPKPLDYTGLSASDKVYDATPTATLSGSATTLPAEAAGSGTTSDGAPYTGDTVSFTTGTLTGTFADPNVANAKPVTVTGGVALTAGGQSGNYSVGLPNAPITASITALPVRLTGSRNYDGTATAAASILTITNNLDGGNLTLSGSATLPSANGGLQTLSSFAGLTLSATAAGNYTFVGATGTVRINPAPGAFAFDTITNYAATVATLNLISAASDAGVTLNVSAVASPSAQGGTAVLNANQTITYDPATNYAGPDSFNYTLSDDVGGSSPGTVMVQVNPGNAFSLITNYVVNIDGSFSIIASGLAGQSYDVQTADTVSGPWSEIGAATALTNGVIDYTDTDAPNHPSRVYRLTQP